MIRLLFVDDEPNLLQGLKRTLRPMRNKWDMIFVASGKEALEAIAKQPVDIVITDMRMPDMDGATLLGEVKERFPRIIRIILSGQTDQEEALRTTVTAHQFLSKPCDVKRLKDVINRACSLQEILADSSLKRIVSQINALPSPPSIYKEITEELNHPDATIKRVGEIISQDTAMTARVLQMTNSAFFGLSRRITNPVDAVGLLGIDTLKSLVLAIHIFSSFDQTKVKGFSFTTQWTHNVQTGGYASQIAKDQGADASETGEVMIAGILHDIGKLIFIQQLPQQYERVLSSARQSQTPLWQAEEEEFGTTHAHIGAYLLGLWGLPHPVIEAAAFHHEPMNSKMQGFSTLTAVHVANALAHEQNGVGGDSKMNLIDEEYLTAIGMIDKLPSWRAACLKTAKESSGV